MSDTSYSGSAGSNATLTAFFDSRADAEQAITQLRANGIAQSSITLTEGAESTDAGDAPDSKGFFESIGDFFFPDEDRNTYAEGLSRGGFLVTVRGLSPDLYDMAAEVLDAGGAVDITEREAAWRSEGWTGYRAAGGDTESGDMITPDTGRTADMERTGTTGPVAAAMGAAATGVLLPRNTEDRDTLGFGDRRETVATSGFAEERAAFEAADRAGGSGGAALTGESDIAARTAASGSVATGVPAGDDTLRVMEERLTVGKRDVNLGRVRVRAYVRETPVSEDVTLSSERVTIERRPVDRAVTGDDAFRDQSIEAEEHREEAVVSKEARVIEEILLRKDQESRKETVSDSVRHTEVEIEDERSGDTELHRQPKR